MAKKKHDFKGLINLFFMITQLMNIFFSLALSEGFYEGAVGTSTVGAMPTPGSIAIFFPFYLCWRGLAYKICHWLGYHAQAEMEEIAAAPTYYRRGFYLALPEFAKNTAAYKKVYGQRNRFFQPVFYLGFIVISWAICYYVLKFCYFFILLMQPQSELLEEILAVILVFIVMISEHVLTRLYYQLFPKLFHLKVILVEHGQPIFGKLKNK